MGRGVGRALEREDGFALVLALATLLVLTTLGTTIALYTTSNQTSAHYQSDAQAAQTAAEAGLNDAVSVVYAAPRPLASTLFTPAPAPLRLGRATVTYGGALVGNTWTLTATAVADGGKPIRRLYRTVVVNPINPSGQLRVWDRLYNDDATSCLTFENVTVPKNLATRGNLCLLGTATMAAGPLDVGGWVTLDKQSSIGTWNAPLSAVNVGRGCAWNNGALHSPCTRTDHVYASSATAAPATADMTKPAVDFDWWYANAAPGPMHPCTTASGTPPTFDTNGVFDKSLLPQELAPSASSYTCQVRDTSGALVGELSWNNATHVLDVRGTIFIDGDALFDVSGETINYHGQATIYTSGSVDMAQTQLCAGGAGNTNCKNAGMGSWDPTQNILVFVAGAKNPPGYDVRVHDTAAAFQGAAYGVHDCLIGNTAVTSAPLICNRIVADKTVSFFTWPKLGALLDGETIGFPQTTTTFTRALGPVTGW